MQISKEPKISTLSRIRYPELTWLGDYSIIDDFCYISTQVSVGRFFHIAPNCTISGGQASKFIGGSFGGISSGCRIFCSSDNFIEDLATVLPIDGIKNNILTGDVVFKDYATIGAGSVVMPGVVVPEGTVIGAMSFVTSKMKLEPWRVYGGYHKLADLGARNKDNVLRQVKLTLDKLGEVS